MLLLLTLLGIAFLTLLIAYFKLNTFISFIVVTVFIGLSSGMSANTIASAVKSGIGATLSELIMIIGFGAMLGKIVADSGAAQQITNQLTQLFGKKYLIWGLALTGFIIGIPLFYNAGFMIVMPFVFSIARLQKLPLLYVAIPLLSALSVAHGFLPPHPSPVAIANQLHADLGLTLRYGLLISIPAIALAGPLFGTFLKHKFKENVIFEPDNQTVKEQALPPIALSLFVGLLPVGLLLLGEVFKKISDNNIVQLLAQPFMCMLLAVLIALYLLGIRQGKTMASMANQLDEAFKSSANILLIIAGAGALKEILTANGTTLQIGELFSHSAISPLILGWLLAGFIRVCVGSATVAGLTAVGILAPIITTQTDTKPELMVLAIGAGSLMLSHLNDGGFWLFKEYFKLSIKDTLRTWTVMESIVSVVGLLGVLLLDFFV